MVGAAVVVQAVKVDKTYTANIIPIKKRGCDLVFFLAITAPLFDYTFVNASFAFIISRNAFSN